MAETSTISIETSIGTVARERPEPLPPRLDAAQLAAHQAFIETLGPDAIWSSYSEDRVLATA